MNKNFLKGFTYFFKFAWKNEKNFILYSILKELLLQLSIIIVMIFPKLILDSITQNKSIKICIIYIFVFTICLFIVRMLISLFSYLTENYCEKLEIKSEIFFSKKSTYLDYKFIESKEFLDMRELATKYMYSNGRFGGVYFTFLSILSSLINFIFIFSVISVLNFWIIIILTFLTCVNSFVKAKQLNFYAENEKDIFKIFREADIRESMFNSPDWSKEVRVNNLQDKALSHIVRIWNDFLKNAIKGRMFSVKTSPIFELSNVFTEILKYLYLGIKVLNGQMSIGSFTLYCNAISNFSSSLTVFFENILSLKSADLYYKEFDKFIKLDENNDNNNKIKIDEIHSIEFQNVFFKYPNADKYTLKNINLKINDKEKLLIVGENGAGKTTFIKLLMKLYTVEKGKILINGININDIDYLSYMNCISVVFQDFKLFSYSIKDNVTLFNQNISESEIYEVLKQSGFIDSLNKFEKGIYTTIYKEFDDSGIRLSGGEEQKLSISKALLKNSSMAILDEPTAALDPRSEYDIYTKFNSLVQNKISIYISHRLSSAKICDKVAVFENGEIIEYGTHNELLELNGVYNELYSKQAQYYNESVVLKEGEQNV